MGGSSWVDALANGFPLIGRISYPGVFPQCDIGDPINVEDLIRDGPRRWQELERILRATPEDTADLWQATLTERDEGWLDGPFYDIPAAPSMPVRRFAVRQGLDRKLRPCDNFKRNKVNEATAVTTPIVLPSSDHLA